MNVQTTQSAATTARKDSDKMARAVKKVDRLAEQMALSLALDEQLVQWQREGQIGFVLPVGEWAGVLAVAAAAPRPDELIFPGLRESRVALFRGLPLEDALRQYLGLDAADAEPTMSQAGHALPGTLVDAARRVAAPSGGPGAHLVHAVGAAMAARLQGRKEAALVVAGASALEGDDCHAALNFAAVFKAPVVFLFRGDPSWKTPRAVERASGYAVPASFVSGDDLAGLRGKLDDVLASAREGRGPALVEVGVPRDAQASRTDPTLKAAALARCQAAFAEARKGRLPAVSSLVRGVFADVTAPLEEQARDLRGELVVSPEEI